MTDPGINVVAIVKGCETYVIIYSDGRHDQACRMLGEWAHQPDLSFTWYDAAVASQRIRKMQDGQCAGKGRS